MDIHSEKFKQMLREAVLKTESPEIDVDAKWNDFKAKHISAEEIKKKERAKSNKRIAIWSFCGVSAIACAVLLFLLFQTNKHIIDPGNDEPSPLADTQTPIFEKVEDESSHILLIADGRQFTIGKTCHYNYIDSVIAAHRLTPKEIVIRTPRKQSARFWLPDGSEVWLNAESQLSYKTSKSDLRSVMLNGEAFFSVTKGKGQFVVETPYLKTQVFGTKFNVRAYSREDAHVTLIEGSVKVSTPDENKQVILAPGEDIRLSSSQKDFVANHVDVDNYLAWKDGDFYFDDEPLENLLMELGRWYNITVYIKNHHVCRQHVHFTASHDEDISDVIGLLNMMGIAKITLKEKEIIVE